MSGVKSMSLNEKLKLGNTKGNALYKFPWRDNWWVSVSFVEASPQISDVSLINHVNQTELFCVFFLFFSYNKVKTSNLNITVSETSRAAWPWPKRPWPKRPWSKHPWPKHPWSKHSWPKRPSITRYIFLWCKSDS